MKVPANGFSSFIDRLENIAHESLQRSIEGQDVTEEYIDLESRLKAKQIMEEQYVAFMKKRPKRPILSLLPTSWSAFNPKSSR